jgi:putative toxin-antitoxin system antitoxin component (TIGR02293 family)
MMTAPQDQRKTTPVTSSQKTDVGWREALHGSVEAIEIIREGLRVEAYVELKEKLALTKDEVSSLVHISPRTLTRRKKEGRLKPDESERIWRLLKLVHHAADVLGGVEGARAWMREPNFALGDETPLRFADTEPGARRVDDLLGQIEYGILV